jgi:glucosyl-dolichyl phosphate glucuronosyltransferase
MISIIICTYNRSESLKRTLKSLKEMLVPDDLEWELLVVDNNSTDKTKEVVNDFIKVSGLNCRYIFENKLGLSNARNRGVKEAGGEIIAFTDDDVIVDKYWLQNMAKVFKGNNVSCVGGRIFPIWGKPCPEWLINNLWLLSCLYGPLALLDYGDNQFYLEKSMLWGANFAVRKRMFGKYGAFNTSLGRIPGKLYAGEETALIRRLIENGEKVLYAPDVIVHHCIPSKRMRKSYFRKWWFDFGEMQAVLEGPYHGRNIMGIPLYEIKQTVMKFFQWALTFPRSGPKRFKEEEKLLSDVGSISGRLKIKWSKKYNS